MQMVDEGQLELDQSWRSVAGGQVEATLGPSYMGVSKNRGTPKWMMKIVEIPIKIDDLGGCPIFLGTPIW